MPHVTGYGCLATDSPRNVRTVRVVNLQVRGSVVRGHERKVRLWVIRRIRFDSTRSGRVLHYSCCRRIVLPWLDHVRLRQGVVEVRISPALNRWWVEVPEHLSGCRIECVEVSVLATLVDHLGGHTIDIDVCQHDAPGAVPVPKVVSRGLEGPDGFARCLIEG